MRIRPGETARQVAAATLEESVFDDVGQLDSFGCRLLVEVVDELESEELRGSEGGDFVEGDVQVDAMEVTQTELLSATSGRWRRKLANTVLQHRIPSVPWSQSLLEHRTSLVNSIRSSPP